MFVYSLDMIVEVLFSCCLIFTLIAGIPNFIVNAADVTLEVVTSVAHIVTLCAGIGSYISML